MSQRIICDGDSLTIGTGTTSYPTQLKVDPLPQLLTTNLGVGGQTLQDMEADGVSQVDALYDPSKAKNILVCWGGLNDFNDANEAEGTRALIYGYLDTYVANRQAKGWTVIVCTLTAAGSVWIAEATRQWFNNEIRTTLVSARGVIVADLGAANSLLGDSGDNLDTTYFNADQTHLLTAGYTVVKDIVRTAILTVPGLAMETHSMSYTDFCCRSGGSNLNAGTRNGNSTEPSTAAAFTYASGTWVAATGVFTPASGNPQTDGVEVGDFASVYPDAATVGVFVGRVTARNATTITVSLTAKSGTAPIDGTTNTTLKIGGAWKGPNAAESFPLGFVQSTMSNVSGDAPRINFKNAAQYDVTAAMTHVNAGPLYWQGYTTAYGDLGRATIDGGVAGASYVLCTASALNNVWTDFIFANNGATGTASGFVLSGGESIARRITAHDMTGIGLNFAANVVTGIECEAYACNKSNSAAACGIAAGAVGIVLINCVSRDHPAGTNCAGFFTNGAAAGGIFIGCIADTCGGPGFSFFHTTGYVNQLLNCEAYNNGVDGVRAGNTNAGMIVIRNSNFVKNAGYGINFSGSALVNNGIIQSCGFGAGTQINTLGQINQAGNIVVEGSVTYADDVTPWTDPANGNFIINLSAAKSTGKGSYPGGVTIGYPDIGSAQHQDTVRGISRVSGLNGGLTT